MPWHAYISKPVIILYTVKYQKVTIMLKYSFIGITPYTDVCKVDRQWENLLVFGCKYIVKLKLISIIK